MVTFDDNDIVCLPSFISGDEINDYYNLFTIALNKFEVFFSISDNEIDDYHNLFTTTLNKSGFMYNGSIPVGDDSEFLDLFFL